MSKELPTFQAVLDALLGDVNQFPDEYLRLFSDISRSDLEELSQKWGQIAKEKKIFLLNKLVSLMENDSLILCNDLGKFALIDGNSEVKIAAIRLLKECSDPDLIETYINFLDKEEDTDLRIAAASALGKFILLGELEEINSRIFKQTLDKLKSIYDSNIADDLKQEILKTISYSDHGNTQALIKQAYSMNTPEWKETAIISMGRSADPNWEKNILDALEYQEEIIVLAAIRAAGELALDSAQPILIEMLKEGSQDLEITSEIINALGNIGGSESRRVLEDRLNELEFEDELEFLESALDIMDFYDQLPDLDI